MILLTLLMGAIAMVYPHSTGQTAEWLYLGVAALLGGRYFLFQFSGSITLDLTCV